MSPDNEGTAFTCGCLIGFIVCAAMVIMLTLLLLLIRG